MKSLQLPSTDGKHMLHVALWEPQGKAKGILQISHGMVEFIDRYDEFATYLTTLGYVVIGNDHLGHGKTAGCDEDLGYFCEKNQSQTVVADLHEVTLYAKQQYPGLPYFLLGHSMGSFMARRYLMTYGTELTGAIIVGTGSQPEAVLTFGKLVCAVLKAWKGDRHRSTFIQNVSFKGNNDRIKPLRTQSDWLTKDEKIVDQYRSNKYCSFNFTVNGYQGLFEVISFIQKKENMEKIPKELPILLISGKEDPVGGYGKHVEEIYAQYKAIGIKDIRCKLYEDDRHEILNELDRQTVYEDIANWLERLLV